jgi:hypothetical protein
VRKTDPKLKQHLERKYPKHDWCEQALIHTQKVECPLFSIPRKSRPVAVGVGKFLAENEPGRTSAMY